MLGQKEIRDLSIFDMPFSLYLQDIYERSKSLGFSFELKKYAKEALCQGFACSKEAGEVASYVCDRMRHNQGGNWFCYILTAKAMRCISWHDDGKLLKLGFKRDGVEYKVSISRTKYPDFDDEVGGKQWREDDSENGAPAVGLKQQEEGESAGKIEGEQQNSNEGATEVQIN